MASLKSAAAAELGKIGSNGVARVETLQRFFTGLLGNEASKQISGMMVTAGIVHALEQLAGKYTAAGIGARHQTTQSDIRLNGDAFDRMSPGERLDYSRQFDQSKMPAWKDPRG
jgi:hypothetical protein